MNDCQHPKKATRATSDGLLVTLCVECGDELRSVPLPVVPAQTSPDRRRGCPFRSMSDALAYYVEHSERVRSPRSMLDVMAESAKLGCQVAGGAGSARDGILATLASVEQCLPRAWSLDGAVEEEGVVAKFLILATVGGSRIYGLSVERAAEAVRDKYGARWSFRSCRAVLERAVAETRGELRARGLIPNTWEPSARRLAACEKDA